jgi:Protein of unknown function (DUF3237)
MRWRHGTVFFTCTTILLVSLRGALARGEDEPLPLRSEFLMQMSAELEDSQQLGESPVGGRRIVYVKGGQFAGAGLKGQVLPGGGDWVVVRKDGASQLDVRITLRTDDGALIYVTYRGISTMTPEMRQRILKGEAVNPSEYYFRTTPVFETAAEKYVWLNKLVAVGVGRRTRTGVEYSVYAIR